MPSELRNVVLYVPRRIKRLIKRLRPTQDVFREIYRDKKWGDSEESVSGPGSSMAQTAAIRAALPEVFKTYHIRSMLDVPCGDFHWMKTVDLSGLEYTGGDIVPELISEVQKRFASPGGPDGAGKRQFAVMDIIRGGLPKADLIMCRDCLFHLTRAQIEASIKSFKASGAQYLLTTTFWEGVPVNQNIVHGEFRPINLQIAPFNFPTPLMLIDEGDFFKPLRRGVGLWRLSDLPG